jgi:hypothetical protein
MIGAALRVSDGRARRDYLDVEQRAPRGAIAAPHDQRGK